MASYAPVYRLPNSQSSFLTREQKRGRKRKRSADADSDEDEEHEESESGKQESKDEHSAPVKLETIAEEQPRVLHPVNKKDPYYVAGWSRETPLPGGSFPHAAIKEAVADKLGVEEELAKINPPIYVPKKKPDDPAGSLRGRHVDNLTAILHKCMLNQDWERATRVWGLILRTETAGFGPDIRKNGRWTIGAELLMRKGQTFDGNATDTDDDSHNTVSPREIMIPDRNFELARDFYGRLCVQYPQSARSHHSSITAGAIYPAMFNIWIYEVQDRSKRARQKLAATSDTAETSDLDEMQSVHSDSLVQRRALRQIRYRELHEVTPIARGLDELLVSPPHDTNAELLETRGMVSLWLADLHKILAEMKGDGSDENEDEQDELVDSQFSKSRHQRQALQEHAKAKETFQRVLGMKLELSPENLAFLEGESSILDATEDD